MYSYVTCLLILYSHNTTHIWKLGFGFECSINVNCFNEYDIKDLIESISKQK